ncbi:hypothetical protein ACFL54_05460 [Planctomycetota bacterium]
MKGVYFILFVLCALAIYQVCTTRQCALAGNESVLLQWQVEDDGHALVYERSRLLFMMAEYTDAMVIFPADFKKEEAGLRWPLLDDSTLSLIGLQKFPARKIASGKKWQHNGRARIIHNEMISEPIGFALNFSFANLTTENQQSIAEIHFTGQAKNIDPKLQMKNIRVEGKYSFNVSAGRLDEFNGTVKYEAVEGEDGDTREQNGACALKWRQTLEFKGDELDQLIADAIKECADALAGNQDADGYIGDAVSKESHPMGSCALALLALLKSGADKDSPVVQKAFAYLRNLPLKKTYSVSLLCMAIEAFYTPLDELKNSEKDFAKESIKRKQRVLSPVYKNWMTQAVNWLVTNQGKPGSWTYCPEDGKAFDNSNSQYAVLGLYAAARCGVFAEPKHWQAILKHWLNTQQQKGEVYERIITVGDKRRSVVKRRAQARGWAYLEAKTDQVTYTMTCGGVSSVAIALACLQQVNKGSAKSLARAAQASIQSGLAWLEKNYTLRQEHIPMWYVYYMYGFERACVLNQTRYLGLRDWYREGAAILCTQPKLGNKNPSLSRWGEPIGTSFILLFLKRATVPLSSVTTGK